MKIMVYSIGLCYASVCANNNLSIKEITKQLNKQNPTGLNHGWELAEGNFKDGIPNGSPCNIKPKIRKHYLFNC